jgi:hypothetical protein
MTLLDLKFEIDKIEALRKADSRKILWLAMHTPPWMECPMFSTHADVLAEVECRLYPEYDGDKVKFTEWGWSTPEGEIRYVK